MTRHGVLIGIDIGSTVCKVQAITPDGQLVALNSATTPWEDTVHGRQLDAEVLFGRIVESLAAVRGAHTVLGIGVTGFAESGVVLDQQGRVLTPVLPWYDPRGAEVLGQIEANLGARGFAAIAGLPLNLKPSVMKFGWLMAAVAPKTSWSRWLNIPEWVAYRLTGELASEPSLSSRTGMFDVGASRESGEVLDCVGAPRDLVGPLVHAGEPWGTVGSSFTGLAGAVVTVCGMDHLVAGVGVGAVGQMDLLDSCGTGEALIRRLPADMVNRSFLIEALDQEIAVGRDIFPDQVQLTTSLRSGIGMWRFLKLMGKGEADMDALDQEALKLTTTPSSPVVDRVWLETAVLANIGYEPTPASVWRAAVESVQRRAAVLADRMQEFAGAHERVIATGGGLRSLLVRTLKREILGPYEQPDVVESASRGAALFAGMAAGCSAPITVIRHSRGVANT